MADQTLRVRLTADYASLKAGLVAGAQGVKKFEQDVAGAAQNTKINTDRMARGMLVAGGVIAAGFGAATVAAVKFEQALVNVTTISPYVARNFDKVGDSLIEMSNRLPQSAKELAEGLYDVASSGFAGADGMQVLEASATAASAGLSTTATAARAITAVLNAYGLQADASRQVSDVLFQTVNLGVVTFEELAQNIGDVVGVSAAAKIGIKDVGGAIATITLAGVPAAEATTSLNRVIQSILDPSDALAANLKAMGYESGEAALHALGLQGVLTGVTGATDGTATAFLELFPEIRAARGVLALMANGGENWTRVAKGMDGATKGAGATAKALAAQQKSLGYQLDITKNQIVNLGIQIGRALLPVLKVATGMIQDTLGFLKSLPGPLQTVIVGFIALTGAVLLAGGAFLKLNSMAGKSMEGLAKMGTGGEKVAGAMGKVGPALMQAAAGGAIVAASMQLVGKESELAGVGILGMAAGGAMIGSAVMPGLGTAIGAATGFIAGMTMELTNSGPAVEEYRAQFTKLGQELDGLTKTQALKRFVSQLGASDAMAAASGDARALSNEIRALAKGSPESARTVIKALSAIRDDAGKPLYDAKQLAILEKAYDSGALAAERFAARKKKAGESKIDVQGTVDPLKSVQQAADDASAAVKAYSDNIEAVFNPSIAAEKASLAWDQALRDVTTTIAENGNTLDRSTEQGLANRNAMADAAAAANDHAEAVYRQTGNITEANRVLGVHIDDLAQTARNAGLSEQAAIDYTGALLGIPPELMTNVHNTADLAKVAMDRLQTSYNKANGLVITTYVKLEGVDLLVEEVARVKQQIGSIAATVPTSSLHGRVFNPTTGEWVDYAKGGITAAATGYITPRITQPGQGVMFNEVQAGGESYIPWNPTVRGRATGILMETANAFGYGLVKRGGGSGITGINVATTLVIGAPVYGDQALAASVARALRAHDEKLELDLRRHS